MLFGWRAAVTIPPIEKEPFLQQVLGVKVPMTNLRCVPHRQSHLNQTSAQKWRRPKSSSVAFNVKRRTVQMTQAIFVNGCGCSDGRGSCWLGANRKELYKLDFFGLFLLLI